MVCFQASHIAFAEGMIKQDNCSEISCKINNATKQDSSFGCVLSYPFLFK